MPTIEQLIAGIKINTYILNRINEERGRTNAPIDDISLLNRIEGEILSKPHTKEEIEVLETIKGIIHGYKRK